MHAEGFRKAVKTLLQSSTEEIYFILKGDFTARCCSLRKPTDHNIYIFSISLEENIINQHSSQHL